MPGRAPDGARAAGPDADEVRGEVGADHERGSPRPAGDATAPHDGSVPRETRNDGAKEGTKDGAGATDAAAPGANYYQPPQYYYSGAGGAEYAAQHFVAWPPGAIAAGAGLAAGLDKEQQMGYEAAVAAAAAAFQQGYPWYPQQLTAGNFAVEESESPESPQTEGGGQKRSRKKGGAPPAKSDTEQGSGRKPTACRLCKKRKRSCDGTRPQCNRCVSAGIPCSYPDDGEQPQLPVRKVACVECHRNKKPCVGAIPAEDGSEEAVQRCERCTARDVPCIIPKEQYVRKKGPTKSPGPEGAAAGQKRTNGATEGEEADEDGTAAPKAKRRRKAADSSAAMSSAEGIVEEHEVDEAGIVYGQHTYHYWPGVAPGYPPLSFENGLPEGMAAAGHPALEGLGDIQAAQLQLSGPAPNAETQADMSAFNVVHLPDEPTVGMVILPPNVPLPFLGMGGDAAKRFELNIDSLRGTDLGASIFGIKPSFPKSSCVAPMTPPSPRKALVDPFPTPSTLGSGHSVIPRPLSPITLRCPLSDACAAAHISHFLRYNYPVINVVHPEYMLERIAQRTCEPALFWSALGIASLACSHCPECREGMVKRAVMQRSSLELHSAVRSALSRPWRTREEWYGRVQLVTALFVQTATAFSVKNLVASVKLRIPAAILLTDRTGIGICADLTPPWTISTGKEWIEWEEALRAFWIPRNLGPFWKDVEPSSAVNTSSSMVPLAADLPTNDPLFENVHSRDRLDRLPVHAKAADLLGWLCSSPGGEGSAAIADAVPKLVECGSIASNSVISTFMNLLIEFRLFALEHRISWVALKTRQAAGRPYGNDPLGTAVAEIERINWLLDSYIVALPPAIRSCIEEGDAAALCDAFGSIWGAPNREKFATQMLIYLSMQVVAKSHMCVGHEAGQTDAFPRTRYPDEPVSDDESSARKWEQATDERAFVASPSLLESTRFAILGTELVRSLLQVNSKPVFISQFTAMAMLRIGFVHLLAYKTFSQAAETSVEAWQTASREAVLSKELLATCTYVMNLSLRYVSITAHALRPTKALLEEVERAGHLVRDVIAEAENL